MAALSEALHRLGRLVGVDAPDPDHQLEISRARELLKRTPGLPDRAAGTGEESRGLGRKLRSGDVSLPFLGWDLSSARGIWNHTNSNTSNGWRGWLYSLGGF